MQGWVEQVNAILSLHGYTLLTGKGTRSSADAKAHAKAEYEKFRPIQDEHFVSDFDKMVAKTLKNKHGKNCDTVKKGFTAQIDYYARQKAG